MQFGDIGPHAHGGGYAQAAHSLCGRMMESQNEMRSRTSNRSAWKNPILYKTTLCDYWLAGAPCRFGETCWYAHGQDQLRFVPRLDGHDDAEQMRLLRRDALVDPRVPSQVPGVPMLDVPRKLVSQADGRKVPLGSVNSLRNEKGVDSGRFSWSRMCLPPLEPQQEDHFNSSLGSETFCSNARVDRPHPEFQPRLRTHGYRSFRGKQQYGHWDSLVGPKSGRDPRGTPVDTCPSASNGALSESGNGCNRGSCSVYNYAQYPMEHTRYNNTHDSLLTAQMNLLFTEQQGDGGDSLNATFSPTSSESDAHSPSFLNRSMF